MNNNYLMTNSFKSIFKNFSYSLLSNVMSTLISAAVVILVPKLIGKADYGYYQLYVFYASYTGFFHFGWADGIYLKYGGIEYNHYNRPLMSSQFWYMIGFETILSLSLSAGVLLFVRDIDRVFILILTSISILFVIPKTLLSYLLQISNRIREYSLVVVVEKAVYFLLTIILLIAGCRTYRPLIVADILGKLSAAMLGVFYCRDIVKARPSPFSAAVNEAWSDICIGIKLMVANIASMLILGIVRMSIERQWDIETYATVSLAISVSNMLLVCINAVGTVLFPILKRMDSSRIHSLYMDLRDVLMILLLGMLLSYYPIQWLLSLWLPSYAESFTYMSLLFPMCIYESKMSLLVNTYFKALRQEKWLMIANATTVVLSVILSFVTIFLLHSITLAMVVVVVLFAFRCIFCEVLMGRLLQLHLLYDTLLELFVCIAFMCVSSMLSLLPAMGTYLLVYCGYLLCKRQTLRTLLQRLSALRR